MEVLRRYVELLQILEDLYECAQEIYDDELPASEWLMTHQLDFFKGDVIRIIESFGYEVKFYDNCVALYKVER